MTGAFTNPIKFAVGAGLALAGVGLVSRGIKSAKADDLMSMPTAGSGYGDRILVGKEGTYALNNRDTIQASTVDGTGKEITRHGGGGGSASKVESLLEQLVKKNSNVYLDSSKVDDMLRH
jgi:hypothetical protein